MFAKAMIVYEPDDKRLNNYKTIQQIIPQLKLFSARDSINNYEYYKEYGFVQNYHTMEYVNEYEKKYKGKIGCNISHIELLKEFLTWKGDWLLVIEDDLSLKDYSDIFIESIIQVANEQNSDYVHLYTNPNYYNEQKNLEQVAQNIYPMIPQWGGVAYLVNKRGVEKLLSFLPYSKNYDIVVSLHITELNSLCCLNSVFNTEGALHSTDRTSKFGSLLWCL